MGYLKGSILSFVPVGIGLWIVGIGSSAFAVVVAEGLPNTPSTFANIYVEQSFVVPAGSAYDNIVFNFYKDYLRTQPLAPGKAFLLSQIYTGAPNGLNSTTPGYVDSVNGANGYFTFNPATTIQPNTQYYLCSGGPTQFEIAMPSQYYMGIFMAIPSGNVPFEIPQIGSASTVFTITGDAVPEPGSLGLLSFGGLVLLRRRRHS